MTIEAADWPQHDLNILHQWESMGFPAIQPSRLFVSLSSIVTNPAVRLCNITSSWQDGNGSNSFDIPLEFRNTTRVAGGRRRPLLATACLPHAWALQLTNSILVLQMYTEIV
jgi:hypothetical protein